MFKPGFPVAFAGACGVLIGILLNEYYHKNIDLRRFRNVEKHFNDVLCQQKLNNDFIIKNLNTFRNETIELFKNILVQQSRIKVANRPFATMLVEY